MTLWTTTRRTALAAIAATAAFPAIAGRSVRLIAGSYAREGGAGLYPIAYDPAGDRWSVGAPLAGIDDASFGVGPGPGGAYYLVQERSAGAISAYAPDWRRRGTAATDGADPCHVALDRAAGCLAVANYSSGSVAFYRLDPRTGVAGAPTLFRHGGSGPDRDRQAGPHAHWVGFSPDRRWLHAVDLGADRIFAYRFDARGRALAPPTVGWRAPAGAGPRHLVRHPRRACAYVVCELANAVVLLDSHADGSFAARHMVSTLPAGFAGPSQAAHIAIDRAGRRLYVSNRGHNSIAVYALDPAGVPTLLQHVASGGDWPRIFRLLEAERRLIVGNERSGALTMFAILPDGRLAVTGQQLAVPGIVFIDRLV